MAFDAYREDLAFVHDDSFGFIARGAATALLRKLREQGFGDGLVVELAVGSGISSELIVGAGYDVAGYDISESMIEIARRRIDSLPEPPARFPGERPRGTAKFAVESLYDVQIPPCIAVTAIGEAFNYLFDPRAGFDTMSVVLTRAFEALVPGGLLLFDIAMPGRAQPRLEQYFWEGTGWQVLSETVEAPGQKRLERRITTTRRISGEERTTKELHELALYDNEEVFELLREIGFVPHTLASYAEDFRFGAGHGGFLAAKPRTL